MHIDDNSSASEDYLNYYSTKDLYEAAALRANNHSYHGHRRENGIFWFLFSQQQDVKLAARAYWNYQLSVDAKTFTDSIKGLKEIIFGDQ
jgi:hypothetical protein